MQKLRVLGVDLAPNHSGWVLIDENGAVLDRVFITDRRATTKGHKGVGYYLPVPDTDDPDIRDISRLDRSVHLFDALLERFKPTHIGLEGYAFSVNMAHSKGEIGGAFRVSVWCRGTPLRIHDPLSVKKWTTGSGAADKNLMLDCVKLATGTDYRAWAGGVKAAMTMAEDMADAHAIAFMVLIECRLRTGHTALHELAQHQLEVVNRVTKGHPEALLQRAWTEDTRSNPLGDIEDLRRAILTR